MIGLIFAMDEEMDAAIASFHSTDTVIKAGLEFHCGEFYGKQAVIVRCGIGKVNAAACTQLMIDLFCPSSILMAGVAGGIASEMHPGDLVISDELIQHDMDVTGSGHKLGHIPRHKESIFRTDSRLLSAAVKAANTLSETEISWRVGRILTGDQYVCKSEKSRELREIFGGCCVEMEGASVGQVASMNSVPFIVIRSISDMADDIAESTYLAESVNAMNVMQDFLHTLMDCYPLDLV